MRDAKWYLRKTLVNMLVNYGKYYSCTVLTSIFILQTGQLVRLSAHGSHVECPHWKYTLLLFAEHTWHLKPHSMAKILNLSLSIAIMKCCIDLLRISTTRNFPLSKIEIHHYCITSIDVKKSMNNTMMQSWKM